MRTIYTFLVSVACLFVTSAWGQLSITSLPANYYNNFNNYNPNTLASVPSTINSSGTGTGFLSTSTGWTVSSAGTASYNGQGAGANSTGGYWGYGSAGDFSLGALRSVATKDITYAISFTNNTGKPILSLTIAWDYKQFRYANTSGWDCSGTGQLASNSTLSSKNFIGSATGINGTPTTTSISSFTLNGLSIANGQTFGINWTTTDSTGADNGIAIDNFSISVPNLSVPPVLTAAANATVDNPFTISFPDDLLWRTAITSINYGSATLSPTAYTIGSGQITFTPSADVALQTATTKNILIKATGYGNDVISQTINSGVPTSLNIITQPTAPTTSGGTLTTPPVVNAKDQYGNNSVGYLINAVVTTGQGTSWSLGGVTGVTTNNSGNANFAGLTATNNTAAPYNGSITFNYNGGVFTTSSSFTIPAVAPALTAAANATVDAPFAITFADNASWRAAITSVTYNTTLLVAGTDYTISAGQLTLIPTASNPMSTPGTKNVTVKANGYSDAVVSQPINAGAPFTLTITKQPAPPTAYTGTLATQPVVKAFDKYSNVVTGSYTISATVTSGQVGSWTLGGTTGVATSSTGLATYSDLTATNLTPNAYTASITFLYGGITVTSNPFIIPAPPAANDNCANAVVLTPSANPTAVQGTLISATPTPGNTFIVGPTKNDVWFKFTTTCTASYTINVSYAATTTSNQDLNWEAFASTGCPTTGSGDPFALGKTKLGDTLKTRTANLPGATTYYLRVLDNGSVTIGDIKVAVVINPAAQPSLISGGSTTPCVGNSETYSVTPIAGVTYAWTLPGGDWTGSSTTNSITTTVGSTAGNIIVTPTNSCGLTGTPQTLYITPLTSPENISGASVSPGNGKLTIAWDNPSDCYDEIMVVATDASNVTLIPSGDGSQYIDTTEYASPTKNNAQNMNTGEYCMYKGGSSAIVITGLLNDNPYKVKIYTRWGTQWSSGFQVTGTPKVASTGAFKSVKSGLWTDNTTWNKWNGTSWVATSGVGDYPNYYASDVTIETGHTVQLNLSLMAVQNLEVKAGGQLWNPDAANNRYISVFGNITCDGTIGNANPNTADYIGINAEGFPGASSSTMVISGTGKFSCARLRKSFTRSDPGGNNTTTVNINMDVNLHWAGTALYNNAQPSNSSQNTNFNVVVNSPYKVTLKNPLGAVKIDGATPASSFYNAGGKFTVNGTLTIPYMLYLSTDNDDPAPGCTFEIGSTGVVNAAIINIPTSGTAGHTLTIQDGGLLNVTDTSGFVQYNPKNNFINLKKGSTVQFSGTATTFPQQVLSGQTYYNLNISGLGEKIISTQYSSITVNGNLDINTGSFNLNGKILSLNGTVSGNGTITGSGTSNIIISSVDPSTPSATPLGVLRFTTGRDSLNTLTMDRQMKADNYPNHKYWAAVLGTNLNVAALKLNQGILATDKHLLTLLSYNTGDYSTYNRTSYVATTDTLATPFPLINTYDGSYGFRIKGVKANISTYFPIGADFISPNRALITLNNGAATRDITMMITKGDIIYTGAPRVNRVWYTHSSIADSINANMRLFYTGYDLATYPYLTKQDELETGFTGLKVRLVEKAFLNDHYFTNISNGTDTMFNGSPNSEVYAKYTFNVSTIYNGTKPGIYQFRIFSVVDSGTVVLPVTFTSIRAYQRGSSININWSVANEINIDHYEVERAGDSRLFSTVAIQQVPNSSSGGNSYTAADIQPLTGANYYRIKAVGKDGEVFYSTIVNITLSSDGKAGMLVYPNPIKNKQCTLQLNNLSAGIYNINVYTVAGQLITSKQIEHAGGSSSEKLYLPAGTASGVYIIKLAGQNINMQTSVFVEAK